MIGENITRDAKPDLPADAPEEVRECLLGINIEVAAHKTGRKGESGVEINEKLEQLCFRFITCLAEPGTCCSGKGLYGHS